MRAKLGSSLSAVSEAREKALAGGATDVPSTPNARPAKGARKAGTSAAAAAAIPAAVPVPVNGAQVEGLEPDDIGYLKALREAQVSAEKINGVRTEAIVGRCRLNLSNLRRKQLERSNLNSDMMSCFRILASISTCAATPWPPPPPLTPPPTIRPPPPPPPRSRPLQR